jgi:hypothetical protein
MKYLNNNHSLYKCKLKGLKKNENNDELIMWDSLKSSVCFNVFMS